MRSIVTRLAITSFVCSLLVTGCNQSQQIPTDKSRESETDPSPRIAQTESVKLFTGDLENWAITNFGGEGEVEISDGAIQLSQGYPMTGITWTGSELPTENYELRLEAKKTDGNDFFCGLTFPVGDSHCTLILGGWGGSLVGLSCIDGHDASDNGTKMFQNFETGRWYRIAVLVDEHGIEVKLDDKVIIDQARGEHEFKVRNETLPCRPLGICNYQTSSAIKNLVIETTR